MRGHLLYEIAPYSVHPIEQQNVAVEREVSKPRRIARIKLDPADGIGLGRALRAVAARFEGRADAADEIHTGIVGGGQLERHFARTQVALLAHLSIPNCASLVAADGMGRPLPRLRTMVKCDEHPSSLDRASPSEGMNSRPFRARNSSNKIWL